MAAIACSGGAAGPGEVTRVEARVEVLAADAAIGGSYTPLVDSFIADESAVYWFDGHGAVHARRSGEPEVVQLMPALEQPDPSRQAVVVGIADDEERLFVGQAHVATGVVDHFPIPDFQPPGRLFVVPKDGSAPTLVVELARAIITPIASDAERVIVHVGGDGEGYYQLVRSSIELEPLPLSAPFFASERSGDVVYWSDGAHPPSLFRARFDEATPELVAVMERTEFDVGPGYALSRREQILPDYRVAQHFVFHDAATGGERALPGLGEAISSEALLDARHAYWLSIPGEEPGSLPPGAPQLRLVRVDVGSGELNELDTPGLSLERGAQLLGQSSRHLYVEDAGRILAIDKP